MTDSAQALIDASKGARVIELPQCICQARLTVNEALKLLEEIENE